MRYIKRFNESSVTGSGDDMIVDIVNFIREMFRYGLQSIGGIRIESKTSEGVNMVTGRLQDEVEMLIYVEDKYTIWVRSSSVMVYYRGERDVVAIISYDYQQVSNKDDFKDCLSILRGCTLDIKRSRGQLGKRGDIEYLIPNLKMDHDQRVKDEEVQRSRVKKLNPETRDLIRKMFKDVGLDLD
jgi:hypothetical protein